MTSGRSINFTDRNCSTGAYTTLASFNTTNIILNTLVLFKNDVWHKTLDNVYRFYFSPNNTTYICGGGAATHNGFIVYSSGASGGYNVNLGI